MSIISDLIDQHHKKNRLENNPPSPACITAITGKERKKISIEGVSKEWQGYKLKVFPLYVELRDRYEGEVSSLPISEKKPRGKITHFSKKAANRLKKKISRCPDNELWIDLTFSDDVMKNRTITERSEFSSYCMKRLIAYIKLKYQLHLIWKREVKNRLSGSLKGQAVFHFHCLIGGLTPDQRKKSDAIMLGLLKRWVEITRTTNEKALLVAMNPASRRLIENSKMAICYVSKYFSKTEEIELEEGDSIGRCWGCSSNYPDCEAVEIILTRNESIQFIRHLRRKKNLDKNKKLEMIKAQLLNGWATYFFEPLEDVEKWLLYNKNYDTCRPF